MARRAQAISALLVKVDSLFRQRDTSTDGWIGDAAHASRPSDHNPNSAGVVQAQDFDEDHRAGDEKVGVWLWHQLLASRDPRIKYVIYEGRMVSSYPARGFDPWQVRPYRGGNQHLGHLHLSVQDSPALYDDPRPWFTGAQEDEMVTAPDDVAYFQRILAAPTPARPGKGNPYALQVDGILGPKTAAAIEDWQRRRGLEITGTLNLATCCSLQSHANLAYVDART